MIAGWSSPVARWAHNPKVSGSNPDPATNRPEETQALTSGPEKSGPLFFARGNYSGNYST